ncbi:MAG: GldG family protein [Deltaproteobacteria bacterium]|nr:GldG family protein [Deltaproteobacteria bacterium]
MNSRKIQLSLNVTISLMGLLAIVIMVNYLGARHYARLDWTNAQLYTLSAKTNAVVGGIDDKVTMYVLWSRTDPLFGHLEDVLEGYTQLNKQIHVDILDPDQDPEQFQLIQSQYGKVKVNEFGEAGLEAGVLVVCGDNVKFLPSDSFQEFGDDPKMTGEAPKMRFRAENELTAALIDVTAKVKQTICFTQGHGEWKYEGSDRDSLRHIKKELTLDGFETRAISIREDGIPKKCDTVVVAGPKSTFFKSEAEMIGNYFNRGGRVMLLLDPMFEGNKFFPSGLESVTAAAGIELRNDFILETEPRRLISETPVTFVADRFYTHESVRHLARQQGMPSPVVFSIVRSMKQLSNKDVISDILATTSPVSWGETDLASIQGGNLTPEQDEFDSDGPLTIAMASVKGTKNGEEAGRMVVVGDSDFLSEELFINASLFNRDFWSSLVGWLTVKKEMISISAKNPEQVQLLITESDFANILTALLIEFFLIVGIGITVIQRRRK